MCVCEHVCVMALHPQRPFGQMLINWVRVGCIMVTGRHGNGSDLRPRHDTGICLLRVERAKGLVYMRNTRSREKVIEKKLDMFKHWLLVCKRKLETKQVKHLKCRV